MLLQFCPELCEIFEVTKIVWVLNHNARILLGLAPIKIFNLSNLQLDVSGMALGPDNVDGLRENRFTHIVLCSFSTVNSNGHRNSLCGSRAFIKKRSVRHI